MRTMWRVLYVLYVTCLVYVWGLVSVVRRGVGMCAPYVRTVCVEEIITPLTA